MRAHNPWLALFAGTRAIAAAAGVALLLAHSITPHHRVLAVIAVVYAVVTILAAVKWPALQRSTVAWAADALALLVLMVATETWRSPFYVLGLTALIFPATGMVFRRAVAFGMLYTAAYFALSSTNGIAWETLRQTYKLESFATHLMVPMIIAVALAYAAAVLRRLEDERARSEQLAVEAERRRIAWELHDSAKQRVHAAHLMLSQLDRQSQGDRGGPLLDQALTELQAAGTDIETSLTELRTPLQDVGLTESLRKRAGELERMSDVRIEVRGEVPELSTTVAAHVFRVVGEAMTNAVRHSRASRVEMKLGGRHGRLRAEVSDDGIGLPQEVRPGSNGLRSMRARAGMLGGELEIASTGNGWNGGGPAGGDGLRPGTTVTLDVPLDGSPVADGAPAPAVSGPAAS
ncbi:MAG TPA: ATP-binding protein [Thermoleophilaceae bacterium]|nr:ATP-binding protein [Thermoleophilaceae bacterium]